MNNQDNHVVKKNVKFQVCSVTRNSLRNPLLMHKHLLLVKLGTFNQ